MEEEAKEEIGGVQWGLILAPFDQLEGIDPQGFVTPASNCQFLCDQPVPTTDLNALHQKIQDILQSKLKWTQTEKAVVNPQKNPTRGSDFGMLQPQSTRYQWTTDKKDHLAYVDVADTLTMMALESPSRDIAAVVGSCGGHPFIRTPTISYDNSDGSSSDQPLAQGAISPEATLTKMAHDLMLHGGNTEH